MNAQSSTRRAFLAASAGLATAVVLGGASQAANSAKSSLGIVEYSLAVHRRAWKERGKGDLSDPLLYLDLCRELGAGGIQVSMGSRDAAHLAKVRATAERYGMHVEAIVNPPFKPGDVDAFEKQVLAAKAAGATVARTVIIPGRRYEQFESMDQYREYAQRGLQALQLAEPVLSRQKFWLAVENHKDHRIEERVALFKQLSSEFIGACVDVGNNLALLEDPLETARAFAPWAMTVHIKDHAVRECEDGFMVFDCPLGQGLLDLPGIVDVLRKARPQVKFNLECIIRDAIRVPVLADSYWRTFADVRATDLARPMRQIRAGASADPLPVISAMTMDQQLAAERATISQSVQYAREKLGI